METVNCIICNSNPSVILKTFKCDNKESFNLVKCKCDFVYLNPRPDIKSIVKYYDSQYLTNKNRLSLLFKNLQKISFIWKYSKIKKIFNTNKGLCLDIGSGNNTFSEFLESKKWETLSYDINNGSFKINDIYNLKDNSIDLITMWHSIEHFHNINEIFEIISKKIKDDGYLLIACPNIQAAEIKLLKNQWVAYDIPRHLYHFSPKSLSNYINKFNFKVVSKYQMLQDTIFNIFMSLKHYNIFIRILFFCFILIYSLITINYSNDKSSSYTYVCKIN